MSGKGSIALIGQAAFGEGVLNALVERGENVVAVFCPPDQEGRLVDPVKSAAEKHGISVCQFARLRDAEAIDAFKGLDVNLGVMAFVTDIVPEDILRAPREGTIQYHPSLLPEHRGPSSINWPIIQGKSRTGLTIFWPDAGLDTGPVLMQKEIEIGPDDTLGTVYFDRLFPLGIEALVESVAMVHDGSAPRVEQDESKATYEGWCRAKDCIVDWEKPVAEVYNLVRGADPSPGAGTTFGGEALQLYQASRTEGDSGASPGEIVGVSDDGVVVAAAGGSVLVRRVRPKGGGKMSAMDWAASAGIKEGDRLGG